MFLADELPTGAWIAGAMLLLGAIARQVFSDIVWRNVVQEVREELTDCRQGRQEQSEAHAADRAEWREERGRFESRCQSLEGEVTILRNQVHADRWAGTDPASRAKLYEPPFDDKGE